MLPAGRRTEDSWFDSRQGNFFSSPSVLTASGAHPASYTKDSRVAGAKVTTHRHLVPKLNKNIAIPPLPHTPSLHTYGKLYITHCMPQNVHRFRNTHFPSSNRCSDCGTGRTTTTSGCRLQTWTQICNLPRLLPKDNRPSGRALYARHLPHRALRMRVAISLPPPPPMFMACCLIKLGTTMRR
jgi:hypothetical protein